MGGKCKYTLKPTSISQYLRDMYKTPISQAVYPHYKAELHNAILHMLGNGILMTMCSPALARSLCESLAGAPYPGILVAGFVEAQPKPQN
jgi:hypothetical protein